MDEQEFSQAEPFGNLTVAEKNAVKEKVIFRKHNGGWLPEFQGDTISVKDVNNIIRALRAGYRRYSRLLYTKQRLEVAKATDAELVKAKQ